MAEFQWWLLLVGLVAGGGLVAVVSADGRRREEDLADLERRAEANWIAARLSAGDRDIDERTVESVLRIHREYLALPPPDRIEIHVDPMELVVEGPDPGPSDGGADRDPNEIGDDGRRGTDEDLSAT